MTIPPFPSQDLAKLVLGYLAEEQLMTAYDEFLQASPYLDAFRNEYDRIFMTSLKNIVAEYRAVKIYVETCKPYALRRRLLGCTNLLDVVKFLIQNFDISKLGRQDTSCSRTRSSDNSSTVHAEVSLQPYNSQVQASQHQSLNAEKSTEQKTSCEVCNSLQLSTCVCKNRYSGNYVSSVVPSVDASAIESSVETTLLEDVPGTYKRKKHVRILDKDNRVSDYAFETDRTEDNVEITNSVQTQTQYGLPETRLQPNSTQSNFSASSAESAQKIEEFNDILQVVCNKNKTSESVAQTCAEDAFREFTTGVKGAENVNVQASSSTPSNHLNFLPIAPKPTGANTIMTNTVKGVTSTHFILNVGNQRRNQQTDFKSASPGVTTTPIRLRKLDDKPSDHRITILSNVKVDQTNNENANPPPVLRNDTSTPMMHMQTILINGVPAYRATPHINKRASFTKDEIMAMPTIILFPTTAPAHIPPNMRPKTTMACDKNYPTCSINSATEPLGPLVIDVPSNSPEVSQSGTNFNDKNTDSMVNHNNDQNKTGMLIKTVDFKNASAPKDTDGENKSTPQAQPPQRKSSSTPRRSSHIRVLDFTTPRRILQETINEIVDENGKPVELIVSKSPSLHTLMEAASKEDNATMVSSNSKTKPTSNNDSGTSSSSKENENRNKDKPKQVIPVKHNWDDDLRALVGNKNEEMSQPKPRPIRKKKLSATDKAAGEKEEEKEVKGNGKKKTKRKATKSKPICEETEEPVSVVEESQNVPLKPNINIISGHDWNNVHDSEKNLNKSFDDKQTETPEMERISLQNALGVKLNISDLLETPYKQAIYDIQMETPRFLGPDIPDVPLSDIKITNIPTPRFLTNTPKPSQGTPSTYSSRPTDYSSGGSYYKPDDQDYIPLDYVYPASTLKDNTIENKSAEPDPEKTKEVKQKAGAAKFRPTRKCTKNVSYYKSPLVSKTKDTDEKSEAASSCSDSLNLQSPNESTPTQLENKPAKAPRPRGRPRLDSKRQSLAGKKKKTPIKKESPKSFIKIKPRKATPVKESLNGRCKRKTPDSQGRKRPKEKKIGSTPVAAVPTKSRRKSSTPRKLPCTKNFNSESSGHNSPEIAAPPNKDLPTREPCVSVVQDSDTDNLPLRWSDDASQDSKPNTQQNNSVNESEDISKIKEFIETTEPNRSRPQESNLHIDLVSRGFDVETAKSIERDLLDAPSVSVSVESVVVAAETITQVTASVTSILPVESNNTENAKPVEEEEDDEEDLQFSVSECNEGTDNYKSYVYDDTVEVCRKELPRLKDNFTIEVCIDDDVPVRFRATPFTLLFDQDPLCVNSQEELDRETEIAVSSISNIEKLYTPLKDSVKAQVYEIFDSTLTSLDTPLKVASPRRKSCEAEIVLEVEEVKEKTDSKKRKRLYSSEVPDDAIESKRSKPEAQFLPYPTNIQNIDIETVLSKLHGP